MVINAYLAKGSAVMVKNQTAVKNINATQGFGSFDVCVDKTVLIPCILLYMVLATSLKSLCTPLW